MQPLERAVARALILLISIVLSAGCDGVSKSPLAEMSPASAAPTDPTPAAIPSSPVATKSTWGWQNPRPQGNDISAVQCPSQTVCIANSGMNLIRTTDQGANWTAVSFPVRGGATALACPSTTVCYAASASGEAARSNDGGRTWTELATGVIGDSLVAISCPTVVDCTATGSLGSIVVTTDGGNTWASRRSGAAYYSAFGTSCPGTSTCFLANANGLLKTVDGGLTWNIVLAHNIADITCPSATTCFAGGVQTTYETNDGGGSRFAESTPGATFRGISCSDQTHCAQTAISPSGDGILLATVDGHNWIPTASAPAPTAFISVACASGGAICIAGGTIGALFLSTDAGQKWRELDSAVTRYNFEAVSCRNRAFCVAVGYNPEQTALLVALTRNGGSTWSMTHIPGDESLTAVSCASSSVCVAVGLNANVLTTRDGGATWKLNELDSGSVLNMFVGVSCPSDSVCYAATQGGLVFKSTDGGLGWVKETDLGIQLRGLDCPGTDVCYVASPVQDPNTPVVLTVIAMTVDGGARWSTAKLPGIRIWSLSCVNDQHCVGLGTCQGRGCNGYQGAMTENGGATWTGIAPTETSPYFVSCGSGTSCVAVGAAGAGAIPGGIETSSDGGLSWSDQPIIDQNLLRGVSCSRGNCWAVGDGAAILTAAI